MNLFSRIIILIGILLLLLTLFPAMGGTGFVALVEEDDLPDDDDVSLHNDVPISWIRIPVHQLSLLLRLGISIFALFIVYLGGRSKARRFNDRTIDAVIKLRAFFQTALPMFGGAVFYFLFLPIEIHI